MKILDLKIDLFFFGKVVNCFIQAVEAYKEIKEEFLK